MDMVGKIIAPWRRGAFFGQRSFWGGILALGASSLVAFVLAEPGGLRFPLNVAVLVALGLVTLVLAAGLWTMVVEPAR
jgi:hypothetical protein